MKSSEMINKIRTLLDIQVSLEERKLENGTVVEAESFEKGKEVLIKTEDEKVAMPIGEYNMEQGEVMLVKEEGIISEMKKHSDDYEESEEEMEDDGKEADVQDWAGMEKRIKNLEDAISDIKSRLGESVDETEDLEASEEVVEVVEESEDLSKDEEIAELKEELSKPASDPIKHSPETKSGQTENMQFSKKKSKSIMDTVLSKINN
jgi:hypothetical protein